MVVKPTSHAERTFLRCSVIGFVTVLSLTFALGYSWVFGDSLLRNVAANASPAVKAKVDAITVEDGQSEASEAGAGVAASKTLEKGLSQNESGPSPSGDPSKWNPTPSAEKKAKPVAANGLARQADENGAAKTKVVERDGSE